MPHPKQRAWMTCAIFSLIISFLGVSRIGFIPISDSRILDTLAAPALLGAIISYAVYKQIWPAFWYSFLWTLNILWIIYTKNGMILPPYYAVYTGLHFFGSRMFSVALVLCIYRLFRSRVRRAWLVPASLAATSILRNLLGVSIAWLQGYYTTHEILVSSEFWLDLWVYKILPETLFLIVFAFLFLTTLHDKAPASHV